MIHQLAGKWAFLILDNGEHLIQASAQFAEAALVDCPRTNLGQQPRAAGVAGERALVVPLLAALEPQATLSLELAD